MNISFHSNNKHQYYKDSTCREPNILLEDKAVMFYISVGFVKLIEII